MTISRFENSPHDVVTALDLVPRQNFYAASEIVNRIAQSTHPSLAVEAGWCPYSTDPALGLGFVYIPAQEESKKFFPIKIREMQGTKLRKELFGVPIRGDGFTDWVPVDELYRRSKAGPNRLRDVYEGLSSQFEALKVQIRELAERLSGLRPPPTICCRKRLIKCPGTRAIHHH